MNDSSRILYDIRGLATFGEVKNAIAGMNAHKCFRVLAKLTRSAEYSYFPEFANYVALLNKYAGSVTAYQLLIRIASYNTHVIYGRFNKRLQVPRMCVRSYVAMLERLGSRHVGWYIAKHAYDLQHAYSNYDDYDADPIVNAIIGHKTAVHSGWLQSSILNFIKIVEKPFYVRKVVETYRRLLLYIIYDRLRCDASTRTLKFLCSYMIPCDIGGNSNDLVNDIVGFCLQFSYKNYANGRYQEVIKKVNKKSYAVMRALLIAGLSPAMSMNGLSRLGSISILDYVNKIPQGDMAILVRAFNN